MRHQRTCAEKDHAVLPRAASGASAPRISDQHPLLLLQQTSGNRAVQRFLSTQLKSARTAISSIPSVRQLDDRVDLASAASHSRDETAAIHDVPVGETSIVDEPPRRPPEGDRPAPAQPPEPTDSCSRPLSMTKVVSGGFQGGLTMDDYYPDLVGGGFWDHGGTAGPFDTGTRVGANAQLYGTIPSPCRPDLFQLAQTVTYRRAIFNGVHDPMEGVVQDDIAKSGRDATRAPFRQDWLGGGYNISMADPPSVGYGPTTNVEFDRDFVTSLVGRGGRQSVSWSTSIRIAAGVVTRNTIT